MWSIIVFHVLPPLRCNMFRSPINTKCLLARVKATHKRWGDVKWFVSISLAFLRWWLSKRVRVVDNMIISLSAPWNASTVETLMWHLCCNALIPIFFFFFFLDLVLVWVLVFDFSFVFFLDFVLSSISIISTTSWFWSSSSSSSSSSLANIMLATSNSCNFFSINCACARNIAMTPMSFGSIPSCNKLRIIWTAHFASKWFA